MKNFDLNAYGVSEMSETQTRDVNGGIIDPISVTVLLVTIFAIGYQMGADRAAQDK